MKKVVASGLLLALMGIVIAGAFALYSSSEVEAREGPQNFVVALQGTATGVETDPGVFCFDVDLVDLTTDRVIGVGTDCLDTNSIAPIGDDGGFGITNTTIFHLPGGMIVSKSRTSIQPVEAGGDIFITGEEASGDNITDGSGRFDGVTGSTRLSGIVDMSQFGSGIITFDCIFVININ